MLAYLQFNISIKLNLKLYKESLEEIGGIGRIGRIGGMVEQVEWNNYIKSKPLTRF